MKSDPTRMPTTHPSSQQNVTSQNGHGLLTAQSSSQQNIKELKLINYYVPPNQVNQIKSTIQRIQTDTPSVILRKRPRFPIEQKSCDYTKRWTQIPTLNSKNSKVLQYTPQPARSIGVYHNSQMPPQKAKILTISPPPKYKTYHFTQNNQMTQHLTQMK